MKTRVGLIGLRHPHSLAHLRTLQYLDEVEAVAVCDPSPEARQRAGGESPKVQAAYADVDELLGRDDVPVVAVALANDVTAATVVRCAEAGKHVLCEKPCARSAAEFAPAVAALEQHRRLFCAYYVWRANPAILEMQRLVREGAIGRLTSVELRLVTTQVGLRDPSHWLFRRDVAGGGIVSWLGCHWLDLLRYLTGREVTRVAALTDTISGEAIDVEDVASVALQLQGGAVANLYVGYLLPSGRPGYENPGYDMSLILRGTQGTMAHPGYGSEQTLTLESVAPGWETAPKRVTRYTLPDAPAYGGAHGAAFVRRFLRAAVEGVGDSPAPAGDAMSVLRLLDAIYRSAAEERVVRPEG
ncbi:MAG: Gfo/Idh/MocA family protein [Anaerolineae bacterium]